MEELAKALRDKIDTICGRYHYYKDGAVLEKSLGLAADIRQYCSYFLQGRRIYGSSALCNTSVKGLYGGIGTEGFGIYAGYFGLWITGIIKSLHKKGCRGAESWIMEYGKGI